MIRILLLSATAGLLVSCATTYDGMTEQELFNNYYSCIYLEASRNNEPITENRIRAAHANCHDEVWSYAKAVVNIVRPRLRNEFVSSQSIEILPDLANQAVLTLREAGVIK